jgi:CheY-like chemotaxis protein
MTTSMPAAPSALIVDDNDFNREIFRIALEAADYYVTEAANGVEALVSLQSRTFDLTILDLQMPLVDGITVLKNLRFSPIHSNMVVIIATANPHMAVGDVQALADYVLYKPIDIHEFARLVERLKHKAHVATQE